MLKKIILFFAIFSSLISMLFIFLFNGIKVDSFSLGNFYISQLYIKLDKKLIVSIEDIKVNKQSKVETTREDVKAIISKVPTILKYFEKIDIESLVIQGNHFKIQYDNEFVYLDNKYVNLSSKYSVAGDTMQLDLYSIYLKEQDALFVGKLKLDYFKDIINFFGKYSYQGVSGELNFEVTDDFIDFFVTSEEIKNIKPLKSLFRLDKVAEDWMYKNVTGDMKLNYLYGRLKRETFEPVMSHIKGDAVIKNAEITFNDKVAPAKTKKLHVTFDKNSLKFDLFKPMYKNISIDGSSVVINHLTSLKKGRVVVNIKANHILDDNVLELLKAFNVNVPVKQKDGLTKADLTLDIAYDGSMKIDGLFDVNNANLLLKSFPFYTKKALVTLKDTLVSIDSNRIKHKDMIDTKLKLDIDVKKQSAKGEAFLHKFIVQNGDNEIVKIEKMKLPLTVDFSKTTVIDLNSLKTSIHFEEEHTNISISSFEQLYKYSKVLQDLELKKGKIDLGIVDENNILIKTTVNDLTLPIKRQGTEIRSLELSGSLKDNQLKLVSKEEDVKIHIANKKIELGLDKIDIFYTTREEKIESSFLKNLRLNLTDSNLNIDKDKVFAKNAIIDIKDTRLEIDGVFRYLDLPFYKDGKHLDTFDVIGTYSKPLLSLQTKNKMLHIKMKEKDVAIDIQDMDLAYDTNSEESIDYHVDINGKNSNIIINKKFTVLADSYNFFIDDKISKFDLKYKTSSIKYLKKENKDITLEANNILDISMNTFFNKKLLEGGLINVNASGHDNSIEGSISFHNNTIKNLALLNNLITLVNTSPALINPFLAIPAVFGMVTNGGFNLDGYKVTKGAVNFAYNTKSKILNMKKIDLVGNSVDIAGVATFDLNKYTVDSKLNLIFMKDYSSIIGVIPGLSYLLLGEDKNVATQVDITGNLDDPKIESNILKDSASVPVDIIKRIITSPAKLFKKAKEENKKIEQKKKEEKKKENLQKEEESKK